MDRIAAEHAAAAKAAARQLTLATQADGMSDGSPLLERGETPEIRFAALSDAAALHDALQGKPPLTDVQRTALAQVLADAAAHQNDPGFLHDFFDAAGVDVSTLPTALTGDAKGPDDYTKQIAGKVGGLIAAAAAAGQLSSGAFAQLSSAKDPFSAAMFMKYGPAGKSYGQGQGAAFLAALTQNIEHLVQGDGYHGLTYADFDEVTPILQRCAENGLAARMALGDGSPAAAELARDLLVSESAGGGVDEFGPFDAGASQNQYSPTEGVAEANLLLAAGIPNPADGMSDFHGNDPYGMAAALNVLSAAADMHTYAPGAVLVSPVQNAMSQYMNTYIDDIAKSSQSVGRGLTGYPPGSLSVAAGDVPALLDTVYSDTDQLRVYKTGVGKEMMAALAATGGHTTAPLAHIDSLTSLYGIVNKAETGRITDAAALQDANAADRLMLVNLATGVYGNASFTSVWHNGFQPIAGGLGAVAPQWFDTGHLQAAQAQVHASNIGEQRSVQLMTVQALYNSGTLTDDQKESMSSIVIDGKVTNNVAFNDWYDANEGTMTLGGETLQKLETDMLVRFGWQQ
ncbi:hypothetical protein GCM10009839_64530 [Catenulispora yoronensis]|uniref:Uncharacterized protein n=1 Tax=Catenulispora yoronensis TaxID=450799 RepID=A0ABN2V2G3_9ACTN